jgi:hypothetical protein
MTRDQSAIRRVDGRLNLAQLRLITFWSEAVAVATPSNPSLRNTRCTQLPDLPSSAPRELPSVPRQAQQEPHHRSQSTSRRASAPRMLRVALLRCGADSANSRHFRPGEVYSAGSIHGGEGRRAGCGG